ncbi:hypothetical protein GOODEAATRI_015043 [Goodea atripinnis]|uniref:G-protein coupled receptors family 1 profile domain-containing protein n=1 Tax=Goodea atripinnis TaxID=208336 RepID=A0ABV0NKF5_9TELE
MTLMIPVKAVGDFPGTWEQLYGPTCRFFTVIFYNAQYTCIALLGLISLDRFFKIMMPQSRLLGQSLTMSKVISATVWLVLFGGTGLPNILLTNKSVANISLITTCVVLKGPVGVKFHETTSLLLNIFFWLVSLVIVVCYICIANRVIQSYRNSGSNNSNGKQKIKLRVFLVVIVFFISFGPYHMIRIPYTSQQVSYSKADCSRTYEYLRLAKELSHWLATTNICMDPLIYVFLCREFKEKLMSTEHQKMNTTLLNTSIRCIRDTSVTSVIFPGLYRVGFWQLRAFHCRYSAVLFYITMYISILLLGLISLDRYLKIVKPFGSFRYSYVLALWCCHDLTPTSDLIIAENGSLPP